MAPSQTLLLLTVLLCLQAAWFDIASAKCQKYIAMHSIIQSPNRVQTFDDEGGFREIKASAYSINDCGPHSRLATGAQYIGNFTFIGHTSDVSTDQCVISRDSNGRRVYSSMQAIVVGANGWKLKPEFDLDDIDAQAGVPSADGWKESMAVFGLDGSTVVTPEIMLHDNTLLEKHDYVVPATATKLMGLEVGEVTAAGAEYASEEMTNCPFGRDNGESNKCRASVKFTLPVDTLVIMYALVQKSKDDKNAAAFFSEMLMGCGCRCRMVDLGKRNVTVGVAGSPGLCKLKETTGERKQCDLLGALWCSREEKKEKAVSGLSGMQLMSSGSNVFPCLDVDEYELGVLGSFAPTRDFVESSL